MHEFIQTFWIQLWGVFHDGQRITYILANLPYLSKYLFSDNSLFLGNEFLISKCFLIFVDVSKPVLENIIYFVAMLLSNTY